MLLGPMGLVVPQRAPTGVRPSKEACGGAFESDNRTTSPRFQKLWGFDLSKKKTYILRGFEAPSWEIAKEVRKWFNIWFLEPLLWFLEPKYGSSNHFFF